MAAFDKAPANPYTAKADEFKKSLAAEAPAQEPGPQNSIYPQFGAQEPAPAPAPEPAQAPQPEQVQTAPPSQPKKDAILVIRPFALPKSNRIDTTTTTEIKYGR